MKRVLVLRAREDALRTAEKLRAMGFEPVLSPVLEIVATGATIPPGNYDAVLASSAKGVAFATGVEACKSLPFHAVGAKTALAAATRGWTPNIVAGNAEAILPLLRARYSRPAHFLYLAGRDRQMALEDGLIAAGHCVTPVNVYEANAATALTPEAIAALQAGEIDAALHYSRRSAEIFLSLAEGARLSLGGVRHLALSDDTAQPLKPFETEEEKVAVASTPDEAGLLSLLKINPCDKYR